MEESSERMAGNRISENLMPPRRDEARIGG